MFILDVAGSNQINSSVLLSGALGAIFATALNMLWAKHLDTTNKNWTLQAELRRYRVSRISIAANGLRECFYKAKTQLDFDLVALRGIETEIAEFNKLPIPNSSTSDGVTRDLYERWRSNLQRKLEESIVRSNDHVVVVQAEAKAHVSLLLSETLLRKFHGQMQTLMLELAKEHQASSQGVTERIMVFSEREPMFLQLLKECDDVIAEEITRKLV